MGLSEETEWKLLKQHQDLCKTLNLDKATSSETWKTFKKVYDTIVLEGNPLHWLGCALYVSCKTSTTPTVSKSHVVQGNQVSLSRLLDAVDLSIVDFFKKIHKWVDLQEMTPELKGNLTKLEQVFNVSMILYQKFEPIFYGMFNKIVGEAKAHKSKKLRQPLPSVSKIYELTWTLFLCVKSNFPHIVDDLVNLYPLLLSACDFMYANALMAGRKDLIKNNFSINSKNKFNTISDVPCIINNLCELHDGIPIDVKSVKEYYWRKQIRVLYEKNILKGNQDLLSGILEVNNFDQNFKNINKNYEEFVLSTGSIDERGFMRQKNNDMFNEIDSLPNSNKDPLSMTKKDTFEDLTLPSMKSGQSLKNILLSRPSGPDESIKNLPATSVMEEIISKLSSTLSKKKIPETTINLVNKMSYKLLESILSEERKKPEFDAEKLLTQEIFVKILFSCAFEIISYSMNIGKAFPWILETLDINPYHFYRIIEVVVRKEDTLKKDVVKHLSTMEETILESLAWKKDSPLWKSIIESKQSIPSSEDVIETNPEEQENQEAKMDVFTGKTINLIHSPGAPLADKFLSPNKFKRSINEVEGVNNEEPTPKIIKKEPTSKPKRTGSVALSLFFRKFYYLASVRLKDMCNQLRLFDNDLRMKIWTCFEKTIVHNISLMLDRHLDQMLMCSIYVMCKIVSHDLTFMDMMKCYRNQPQAQSHVYRSVLIKPNRTLDDLKSDSIEEEEEEEEIGDIIKFYNEVYIQKVKDFTKKFRNHDSENFVLSPIPTKMSTPVINRKRVTESLPVFVTGPKRYLSPTTKTPTINYYFARSPAKDLKAINMMVSHEMIPKIGKQLLNNSSGNIPAKVMSRKVKDLIADRMTIT